MSKSEKTEARFREVEAYKEENNVSGAAAAEALGVPLATYYGWRSRYGAEKMPSGRRKKAVMKKVSPGVLEFDVTPQPAQQVQAADDKIALFVLPVSQVAHILRNLWQ